MSCCGAVMSCREVFLSAALSVGLLLWYCRLIVVCCELCVLIEKAEEKAVYMQ